MRQRCTESADAAGRCRDGVAGRMDAERHRATTATRRRECLSGTAGGGGWGLDGELPKSPTMSGAKDTAMG